MAIKHITIAASLGALVLAGCTDPYGTAPNNNQKTKQGALTGAGVGAVVGAIAAGSDDRLKGALIGAGVGAAAGGVIGRQLDKQAEELRQSMNNPNVQIQNTGDRLVVTMPNGILFATDSADLGGNLRNELNALARNLNDYPQTNVQVIGHTDNTGDAGYNQTLSERRAQAVTSALINGGVAGYRVQSIGRGENQPVASNLNETGKSQNRRVEIVILPQQGYAQG